MVDLSIIIVSYNTKEITYQCIQSLLKSFYLEQKLGISVSYEIIVVDNASSDGSAEMLKEFPIKTLLLSENLGYSKANNRGLALAEGRYVLFLNSDVIIENVHFGDVISYLDSHQKVGALTVTVKLPTGGIDPASHRGFPTLWRSFCYYAGLEKVFSHIPGLNRLFGGYHLVYENLTQEHEIDSPTGAFFLTRQALMDTLHGFDESFFMYGEDLDLAFRIKQLGYKIIYYPAYHVTHLKYQSGIKTTRQKVRSKTREYFYDAMKIFYNKHYAQKHPTIVNNLIYRFIDLKYKFS